ncbi:hypothetical protein [Bradyrhizobium liaoningense]|uniref:hypothetical protein n=1 Tax=Bradyrhizobium liaoningense TaxID=43992 RepID=UPI001BACFC97|nr:hypothetical protein [Bradyrhizobium liaoningense]MBR0719382.1 hypothetical protein [Bradyrhizobium liaoningense]
MAAIAAVISVRNFMPALEMMRLDGIKAELGVDSDQQHLLSHAHVTRARSRYINQAHRTVPLSIGSGVIDQTSRFVKNGSVIAAADDSVPSDATAVTNSLLQFQQRQSSWAS